MLTEFEQESSVVPVGTCWLRAESEIWFMRSHYLSLHLFCTSSCPPTRSSCSRFQATYSLILREREKHETKAATMGMDCMSL
jgi:hypothetical protein